MKKKCSKKTNYKKGFSLVELLVVALIFFILTGIVLFKQGKFSSDVLITSTAYELALFIREAQVYGVGSKVQVGATSNSRFAYGVYFSDVAGGDREATLFADVPDSSGNFDYDYDGGDILINKIQFKREQIIHDFCGINETSTAICKADGLSALNITFVKPDLNARVIGIPSSGIPYEYVNGAIIKVRSSLGDKCRTIRVNPLGQISLDPVVTGMTGCESS